jgi:16S rRNA (uracil1498-N3)-methyltransferase
MTDLANTYRFFVSPAALEADHVRLADADLARQIGRVLRLRPGDRILLLDGGGTQSEVALTEIGREHIAGDVIRRSSAGGEPTLTVTLYLALLRAERFEWALQKCVELGAARIVPVRFARSLPNERADARKLERWQRIAREAAEQACRGRLPEITAPLDFAAACAAAATADLQLILWEREAPTLPGVLHATPHPGSIALFSGPEGGITETELTSADAHGIMRVSLGPRILRAETAPIAATAAIFYHYDW